MPDAKGKAATIDQNAIAACLDMSIQCSLLSSVPARRLGQPQAGITLGGKRELARLNFSVSDVHLESRRSCGLSPANHPQDRVAVPQLGEPGFFP
jgi:hypothetical protein